MFFGGNIMFDFLFSPITGNIESMMKELIVLMKVMIVGGGLLLILNLIANMVKR